jgi:hypothetical protein
VSIQAEAERNALHSVALPSTLTQKTFGVGRTAISRVSHVRDATPSFANEFSDLSSRPTPAPAVELATRSHQQTPLLHESRLHVPRAVTHDAGVQADESAAPLQFYVPLSFSPMRLHASGSKSVEQPTNATRPNADADAASPALWQPSGVVRTTTGCSPRRPAPFAAALELGGARRSHYARELQRFYSAVFGIASCDSAEGAVQAALLHGQLDRIPAALEAFSGAEDDMFKLLRHKYAANGFRFRHYDADRVEPL